MQQIIWILQLFQLYICHNNALYAELPTATETLQPSQTPQRLKQRAVPSEMITCDGCGKTENPNKKVEHCSFAYLIMDEGHKYTYVACDAAAATDTYYITPEVPALTKTVSQTTSPSETSKASSDITAVTETSTTSSNTGAIVGGVVGGLTVVCGTAVAVIYLLRKSRAQKPETTPETGQEMTEAPGQTETDNGPKELVGSKPSDVPADRQTAELQGTLAPRRPDPVELP
ncbi:putative E3 ubiquitin-protein ligase ARI8 [Fusarium oxysporum f. sp. albedinis]|nr:putative E3 ubiquitin-protein ligase ARI8 [Fusarium oxysporum f. sp. albedinis]